MSAAPFEDDRASPAEIAAGFLAAISLTASALALVYRAGAAGAVRARRSRSSPRRSREERNSKLAAAAVVAGAASRWLSEWRLRCSWSQPIY